MNIQETLTPISIVIAGLLIAAAVYFGGSNNSNEPVINLEPSENIEEVVDIDKKTVNIVATDHAQGSADAPITIVEYSDMDCPFCTQFHETMNQVVVNYDGKVRWIYRHFPLDGLHPDARTKSLASECVASQKGEPAFWNFTERVFAERTPIGELGTLAVSLGADIDTFNICMKGNNDESRLVDAQSRNARETGGQGTPWSLLVNDKGEVIPINGAQPYQAVSAIIDANL